MKAVLHYRASPGFRTALEASAAKAGIAIAMVDEQDEAGFAREIADAEALLHVLKPVTAAMIAAAPKLKLIQKIGVGVNTIDLDAARARGVAVANMPGTNSQAVAEMALTLMLATLRRVTYFDPLTRAGDGWRPDLAMLDGVGEIAGRTVGFVGYGAAPARLAPALQALGAEIIYVATAPKPDRIGRFVSLDELLETADIVSLHAPLTDQTRHMINAGALKRMKRGSILINTGRGDLVDEPALLESLQSGHLGGAGLDVFAAEPTAADNPLLTLPNVVVMPHVAWLTPETLSRSVSVALDNCLRIRDGAPLLHQVV